MNKYIIRKTAALSYRFKNVMIMALLSTTILSSCLDENLVYETFREEMMGDFIKNSQEQFSEFQRMLDTAKYRDWETDRKSTRLNSSHRSLSRMPSSA